MTYLHNPARSLRDFGRKGKHGLDLDLTEQWERRPEGWQCIMSVRVHPTWRRADLPTLINATAVKYAGDDQAFYLRYAQQHESVNGWGPFVYDLLMERATELGYGLAPDPRSVTRDARNVWDHYLRRRVDGWKPDVWTTSRAPKDAVWIGHTDDDPAWPPSSLVFHKAPTILTKLRATAPVWFEHEIKGRDVGTSAPATDGARIDNPLLLVVEDQQTELDPRFGGHQAMLDLGLERIVADASGALGVTPTGDPYGCGEHGCAQPTSSGQVLKITVDLDEVRWAWAAHRASDKHGFAEIFQPPKRLWRLDEDLYAYAYVREDVTPMMGRRGYPSDALYDALLALHDFAVQPLFQIQTFHFDEYAAERVAEYIKRAARLRRWLPRVVSSISALAATRGMLVHDISPCNIGLRADGTKVLFDGRINPDVYESLARRVLYFARQRLRQWEMQGYGHATLDEALTSAAHDVRERGGIRLGDKKLWDFAMPLARALAADPDVVFHAPAPTDRKDNPIGLASIAALFAVMPVTPVVAGVAAWKARKARKKASP